VRRIAIALAAFLTACTPSADEPTTTTEAPITGAVPARVQAVLDGDSARVTVDGTEIEVRLLGINSPERGECWADEARATLEERVAEGDISLIGTEEDQYGRLLVYLYAGSTNINRRQVLDGSAIAMATEHDELPDFLAAEEEAIALERGWWNAAACGSEGIRAEVRIWSVEPDAPGRDDQNPNGEFVAITNDGPDADLSGWMLRDESSVHRYTFPDGFVLNSGGVMTIRSGCGQDEGSYSYWCADGTVWNNSGDTVLLLDPSGAIVDRVRYFGN